MYRPPIELLEAPKEANIDELINNLLKEEHKSRELFFTETITNVVGVSIDVKELAKLLNDDRKQYEQGYKDGIKEVAKKLKSFCLEMCDSYFSFADIAKKVGEQNER